MILFGFDSGAACDLWVPVNDVVMGGVTHSRLEYSGVSTADFSGTVSLKNSGGFASIRSTPSSYDLRTYSGLQLRVAGQDQAEWNTWTSYAKLSSLADCEKNCRALLENSALQFAAVPEECAAIHPVMRARTHDHGIAEHCRSVDAHLAVLGTRGQSTLEYTLPGSTVERLVNDSRSFQPVRDVCSLP